VPDSLRDGRLSCWLPAVSLPPLSTAALAHKFDVTSVMEKNVSQLPPGPLFWRVDKFPTLGQAQAAAAS
jgi:hypothetical protein